MLKQTDLQTYVTKKQIFICSNFVLVFREG